VVLDLEPLLDALLVEVVGADQFDDLDPSIELGLLDESLHTDGAHPQLIPDLLVDSGGLTDAVDAAVEEGLAHPAVLNSESPILVKTAAVLAVLLGDQDAEDGDEEDGRRVQHPHDHRVLHIKGTRTHQVGEETNRKESKLAFVVLPLE
jgi:hypothetical protein